PPGGGLSEASLACSASLTQVWAISSKRALLVGSLVLCDRRRHWAALSWYSPGLRIPFPAVPMHPITRQPMYGSRQFCDFLKHPRGAIGPTFPACPKFKERC